MYDDFPNDWTTVRKFAAEDSNFTESSVRHYIQHAPQFGLEDAILRAGGRVLVSSSRWYACLQARSKARRSRKGAAA